MLKHKDNSGNFIREEYCQNVNHKKNQKFKPKVINKRVHINLVENRKEQKNKFNILKIKNKNNKKMIQKPRSLNLSIENTIDTINQIISMDIPRRKSCQCKCCKRKHYHMSYHTELTSLMRIFLNQKL